MIKFTKKAFMLVLIGFGTMQGYNEDTPVFKAMLTQELINAMPIDTAAQRARKATYQKAYNALLERKETGAGIPGQIQAPRSAQENLQEASIDDLSSIVKQLREIEQEEAAVVRAIAQVAPEGSFDEDLLRITEQLKAIEQEENAVEAAVSRLGGQVVSTPDERAALLRQISQGGLRSLRSSGSGTGSESGSVSGSSLCVNPVAEKLSERVGELLSTGRLSELQERPLETESSDEDWDE